MSDRIQAKPSDGLSYNMTEPRYWDRAGLNKEIERVFDICHGCRLCFNLCPSFPALFDATDRNNGDVRGLTAAETHRVIELCYGCKLCEIKCPYTPRDGHEFQLDFPRLMLRAKAVGAKENGVAMREKLLGNPDLVGKLGSMTPGLANWGCHRKFQRVIMEKMIGIHRDKILPDFAKETFEKWLARTGLPPAPAEPAAKVALFPTCFVNYYNPGPGKAAVEVFAKNRCAIKCPKQNCCGMPALDGGDTDFARKEARANVDSMLPLVRAGYKIAAINPTCSLMMRKEYLNLLPGDDVKEFAAAVVDPGELLYQIRRAGKFNIDFQSTPVSVAYHVPCHLKAQGIGLRSRDLMRQIPGVQIATVDACSAHDGSWAMKKEFFELSMKWGKKAFSGMRDADARVMASDCPLAAVQIEQATGARPINPLEVLARAYRADGFPDPVPPKPSTEATEA
ncbi:MAG: heterodisulfide reductase-related iron-sulfur binding cluster [Candidatus Binatus sp.]|uniref:heterodisulfide reductase-related iron-sulfur binding cluster n=1 Tax=Candidatus Binatus sp. TaxID=2811406 RepID=UPI00272907DE|nr:heterodisulfide reductase-related iron-sulfur binding cluster [Candidatus Binatus sp.]MDO8432652.1 heterodisulfide reductase-related iron-sulfur binding cluster [Candidatus Binatus sp.]